MTFTEIVFWISNCGVVMIEIGMFIGIFREELPLLVITVYIIKLKGLHLPIPEGPNS